MERIHPDYLFKQFRVPRGCLGYIIAEPVTHIAKRISFPCLALCCTVLRSPSCQSGVRWCRSSGLCADDTSTRMYYCS